MNNKMKSLMAAGIISLGMLGFNVDNADALTYMYTTANVNIRQYNSTLSKKVGYAPKGSKINAYNNINGWYSVYYSSGKVWGYIKDDYLSTSNKGTANTSKGQVLKRLVIVNKDSLRVAYYENGKLIKSMPCAIGKSSTPTPSGNRTVVNKIVNPYYSKKGIAGGNPRNPLGCRWIGIGNSYGLHGTNNESSVGKRVSDGCIRLYKSDIIWLYNKITIGTHVIIGNGYNRNIAAKYGYKIY